MKQAWRDGTAPTRTLDVPDFVERHVQENFVLSMGPKQLPKHKHLEGTQPPLIVRNPPHHLHKSLTLNKSTMGKESATSNQIQIKGRRAVKKDSKLQHHPYAYAAKVAKGKSSLSVHGHGDGDSPNDEDDDMPSSSSLFTKAGVIGSPVFDAYDKYRLDIFPFKEALKHEVKKLVLQKQKLDDIKRQLREERRRQLLEARMRGGSGHHRGHYVQQQVEDEADEEEDDEDTDTTDTTDNTDTATDTDNDDNKDEHEDGEDDNDNCRDNSGSCMCSDCLNTYTPL